MPIDTSKYSNNGKGGKTPELPNLNRGNAPTKQQVVDASNGAIATLINQQTGGIASSLQSVDQSLKAFEERYSDSLVERIDQVPARILALAAKKLKERQGKGQDEVALSIDAIVIEETEIPQFYLPNVSLAGYLPM